MPDPQESVTYSVPPVLDSPSDEEILTTGLPTFSGTAPTGATVTLNIYPGSIADGAPLYALTAQANEEGDFSVSVPSALPQGPYTAQLLGTDGLPVNFSVFFGPGDANGDGKSDFADFVLVSNNYGTSVAPFTLADFNGDGRVDFADYVMLSNNFGKTWSSHFATIRASDLSRTCFISTTGALKCVGWNDRGQLGDGTTTDSATPVAVDPGQSFVKFSKEGTSAGCGITDAGVLKCWGDNLYGQIGDGTKVNRPSPVTVDEGVSYKEVSRGINHTCGVTTVGEFKCWGANDFGQLGIGTTASTSNPQLIPIVVDSGVRYARVAAGVYQTCGITTTGVLKCWGRNRDGGLGDGTLVNRLSPAVTDPGVRYSQVAIGFYQTCGITEAGVLKCWGFNDHGQLGDGTTVSKSSPVIIDAGVSFAQIGINGLHTCGITNAGALKCWGLNSSGQLGDGTTTDRSSPVVIDAGTRYLRIGLGNAHSCGMTMNTGVFKCWGANDHGQLNDGTTTNQLSPVIFRISL